MLMMPAAGIRIDSCSTGDPPTTNRDREGWSRWGAAIGMVQNGGRNSLHCSEMRSSWLYFEVRSLLAGAPVLI